MKGAVIFFSGTGNTQYVSEVFIREFKKRDIESILIDTRKKKGLKEEYDFYVFGSPIHASMFPKIFIDWVLENLIDGKGKECIVFSTQADDFAPGAEELKNILKDKGFNVRIKACIKMPNNYHINKGPSKDEIESLKKDASKRVSTIVDMFLKGERMDFDVSTEEYLAGKAAYKGFLEKSKGFARDNIKVDNDICVKCGKCLKNCPTRNISMKDGVTFDLKCIMCFRCFNSCPENAFLYKGSHIEQYKVK